MSEIDGKVWHPRDLLDRATKINILGLAPGYEQLSPGYFRVSRGTYITVNFGKKSCYKVQDHTILLIGINALRFGLIHKGMV